MATLAARRRLYARSKYVLNGHRQLGMDAVLAALARLPETRRQPADVYGQGRLIEKLERAVARKFGKPAALFFPTGKMAQTAAHGIWAKRSGRRHLTLHPRSHFELHEGRAYHELLGLRAVNPDDLSRKLSATHLEIPLRDFFYAVPTWDELRAEVRRARRRSHAIHLDGARLWETLPYWGKRPREVTALFDSVYVSLYKGIGAISGSMLLGDRKFIAEARLWRLRLGGETYTHYPVLLSAREGWRKRGSRFPAYHRRAKAVAKIFRDLGFECRPEIPRSNGFCVILPRPDPSFTDRAYRTAKRHGIFFNTRPDLHPTTGGSYLEIEAGDETLKLPLPLLRKALCELLEPLRLTARKTGG